MAETRKIAAILAADVIGFSRLAGADEGCTLARLRALRSIDPTIAVHNGRVVKRTGDGSIVEFRSVVNAMRCAIEVRNGIIERDAVLRHADQQKAQIIQDDRTVGALIMVRDPRRALSHGDKL